MAFTASFGFPEPRLPTTQQKKVAEQSPIRFRYLLQVALQRGGQLTWTSLAIANSPEELDRYLKAWLALDENRRAYSGQARFELLPDLN